MRPAASWAAVGVAWVRRPPTRCDENPSFPSPVCSWNNNNSNNNNNKNNYNAAMTSPADPPSEKKNNSNQEKNRKLFSRTTRRWAIKPSSMQDGLDVVIEKPPKRAPSGDVIDGMSRDFKGAPHRRRIGQSQTRPPSHPTLQNDQRCHFTGESLIDRDPRMISNLTPRQSELSQKIEQKKNGSSTKKNDSIR